MSVLDTSPYAVLGVTPGASSAEVRAAYVAAALAAHPDKGGSSATFTCVQLAWEALRGGMTEGVISSDVDAEIDAPRFTRVPIRDSVPICEWEVVGGGGVATVTVAGGSAVSASRSELSLACRCGGSYQLSMIDVEAVRKGCTITSPCDGCSLSVDARCHD